MKKPNYYQHEPLDWREILSAAIDLVLIGIVVLLIFLLSISAVHAQSVQSVTSKDQDTITVPGVHEGNLVLLWAKSEGDGGPLAVTDGSVSLPRQAPVDRPGRVHGAYFYSLHTAPGTHVYTVTWAPGATYKRLIAWEHTRVDALYSSAGRGGNGGSIDTDMGAGFGDLATNELYTMGSNDFVAFGAAGCAGCGTSSGDGIPGIASMPGSITGSRYTAWRRTAAKSEMAMNLGCRDTFQAATTLVTGDIRKHTIAKAA